MKIESSVSDEQKARWKIVRLDNHTDVPGMIVAADDVVGECSMHSGDETKTLNFGPGAIRIVGRGRPSGGR